MSSSPSSNADQSPAASSNPGPYPPLFSDYADDPDMIELVEMFVNDLPERVRALEQALEQVDLDTIRSLSHQLKGSAGGYGFGPITDSAAVVEKCVRAADEASVRRSVEDLLSLCRRVSSQPKHEV